MISARGGDHTGGRNISQKEVGESAARFEGAGVLKLFKLERQGKVAQTEVGA